MRLPIRKDSIIWLVGHQNQSFNNAKEQIVGYTQNDNQVMIVALNNNDWTSPSSVLKSLKFRPRPSHLKPQKNLTDFDVFILWFGETWPDLDLDLDLMMPFLMLKKPDLDLANFGRPRSYIISEFQFKLQEVNKLHSSCLRTNISRLRLTSLVPYANTLHELLHSHLIRSVKVELSSSEGGCAQGIVALQSIRDVLFSSFLLAHRPVGRR